MDVRNNATILFYVSTLFNHAIGDEYSLYFKLSFWLVLRSFFSFVCLFATNTKGVIPFLCVRRQH